MSQEAVDYSFSPPTVASLVKAGKVAAGRYVGAGTEDKQIHAPERDEFFAAGLDIWLSVEGTPNAALGGGKTGAFHAGLAVTDANTLAVPAGVALYANIDFDVTAQQWPACVAYLASFAKVARAAGFRVGVYGGRNAMSWGMRDRVADFYWQTYAWSGSPTHWVPGVAIQQYQNGVAMGGGDVDLCRLMVSNYGQWASGGAPPIEAKDEEMHTVRSGGQDGSVYLAPGFAAPSGKMAAFGISRGDVASAYTAAGTPAVQLPTGLTVAASGLYDIDPQPWPTGHNGPPVLVGHSHGTVGETGPAIPDPVEDA